MNIITAKFTMPSYTKHPRIDVIIYIYVARKLYHLYFKRWFPRPKSLNYIVSAGGNFKLFSPWDKMYHPLTLSTSNESEE